MANIIKRMGHQDQQYGCDNRIHDRLYNQQKYGDPETEARKGQIAITEDDYLLIPDILENYDSVEKSSHRDELNNEVIRYKKEYPDGTVYYIEEIRTGRKSLAFKTMYKKRNGIGSSDGLMHETSPSTSVTTSDNPKSEGKRS